MSDVHVWSVALDAADGQVQRYKSLLPPVERARAERFVFPHLHDRYVVAHAAMRLILADALPGTDPWTIALREGPHGKPALRDGGDLQFNLSHSGTEALLALAPGRHVGVDIERIRTDAATDAVARTVFSACEQAALAACAHADRVEMFFRTWTAKEAYIKAHGRGLSMPLETFDVTAPPGQPAQLAATRPDPHERDRWWFAELPVPSGYRGALIVARLPDDRTPPTIHRHRHHHPPLQ